MLEPPAIPESLVFSRLQEEYTLRADRLHFLPLGADVNTAVYRVVTDGADFFLKLRQGDFDEISVVVPHFLSKQGLSAIISPLNTRTGKLWGMLGTYRMIVYPFVSGQDGYERSLNPTQWLAFGAALRSIHSTSLPTELSRRIPRETFSPHWREQVRAFQSQVELAEYADPIAAKMAKFMQTHRTEISLLVDRAEHLANMLKTRHQAWVLCHSDNHPGNLLLPTADPCRLYIVDWDNPLYAPREHDLALIGGTYAWSRPEDIALFYQSYRAGSSDPADYSAPQVNFDLQTEIDPATLTYYRCERIIVDIAEYCQQLLTTTAGCEDRAQSYRIFTSAFLPDHEVDLALRGEQFT
jgi:spectinomycin phosphotransferase